MKKVLWGLVMCLFFASGAYAGVVNGVADLVLGQPDFVSNSPAAEKMFQPRSVTVDPVRGRVFVSDTYNNRVLWWNAAGLANGKPPDGILGQTVITSTAPNQGGAPTAATLNHPAIITTDASGNVWVADTDNHRVLRFSAAALATGASADLVLGQNSFTANDDHNNHAAPNFLYHPTGLSFDDSGNLWVSDQNHRVVRFSAAALAAGPTNASADLVIGQKTLYLGSPNDSNGDGITDIATAATLNYPDGIYFDEKGNIWVSDHLNHRVLRFSVPLRDGMEADLVLGKADFITTEESHPLPNNTKCTFSVWGDRKGNIWVADAWNNRVLRFSAPFATGMNASQAIGQPNLSSGGSNRGTLPGPDTLYFPYFVFVDAAGNLWISEWANNRVMKYTSLKVLSLDVTTAPNSSPREFIVTGEGMSESTSLKLSRAGEPDIPAQNAAPAGVNQVRCTFDLTGVSGGAWDVVAVDGDFSAVLPGGLNVTAVRVTAVAPTKAANSGPVNVTLNGENFFSGIVPKMTLAGSEDIPAQFVTVISSTQLSCLFDITDASTGFWNITVPPGNAYATLADAFQVVFPTSVVRNIIRTRSYRLGIENDRGIVVVDIPAYAFEDDVTLSVTEPQSLPDVDPGEFIATNVSVEIKNDKRLPLRKDMTITFFYNINAVSACEKNKLLVAFRDAGTSRWLQTNSVPHVPGNNVAAKSRVMSMFRVLQRVVRPSLASAAVYPNPYRPGSGTVYDDTFLGKGIVFSDLTSKARIKIFTVAGEQVADINEDSGTGVYLWNTQNDQGEKVASGVYIYYIVNPDDTSQKRKGTLAIVR